MEETETKVRGGVQHGEGGKFQDKYADDEVIRALAEAYPEPLTNQEVGEYVNCHKNTASNRLKTLVEKGKVRTKKPGANARVYWVDMTEPAPDSNGGSIRHLLEGERQLAIRVSSRFAPDFNPTRTGTDDLIDFILTQPWGSVERAIEEELDDEM